MKSYGIISEFNPFHNGHQLLVNKCREAGAAYITAVMSGNFVQRGDIAIASKHIRTKMALQCGVDLVIELPLPYANANAQVFARGGVHLANQTGCIDTLAFGSECGDIAKLKRAANILTSAEFNSRLRLEMAKGISYPAALSRATEALDNTLLETVSTPNNVLAIEYIKAAAEQKADIDFYTVKRRGDSHNSTRISSSLASASNIRQLISNNSEIVKYIPEIACKTLKDAIVLGETAELKNNERAILTKLRSMSRQQLAQLADITEGLENRLYSAIQTSKSVDEVINSVKTKRYTRSRIRRLIISALLDIDKSYTESLPQYIRVLGFNENGAKLLGKIKKSSQLPIVTKLTNSISSLTPSAQRMLMLEIKSTDIYNTFTEKIKPCGTEYTDGLVIMK